MSGQQFMAIRSKLSGLCLDISGQSTNPGTKVVCWEKNNQKNQMWYFEPASSTIRSQMNDFCLDYNPGINSLVVNPFDPNSQSQKWDMAQTVIRNKYNPSQVIDLLNGNTSMGAQVGMSQFHGNSNQMWDFDVVGGSFSASAGFNPTIGGNVQMPAMDWSKKEFMIRSEMDDKVIDIKNNNPAAGTLICMYKVNRQKNQLWYCDREANIRSCLNDFVFSADDQGSSLKMVPYTGNPKHQWHAEGNKIMNRAGSCLDIRGGKCSNGSELCAYTFKNKENQRWIIKYI